MRVLIIGSGGREHALAWKIKQSSILTKLYVIPGNAGIATIAECIDIPLTDFKQISNFIGENKIELVIIGPEKPLAEGLVDFLYETHPTLKVFGPNKYCAKLESSKAFTKEIGMKLGIPQAQYKIFTTYQTAIKYISTLDFPIVIKADGLAQGKGTFIVENLNEAKNVVEDLLVHKKLQSAGEKIVVESFLDGKEVSYILLTDSEGIINLPPIRDFKKLHKNGPNTGGMGAIAPVFRF
jgi:phosphoribosylamine---glycine ligase